MKKGGVSPQQADKVLGRLGHSCVSEYEQAFEYTQVRF